MRNNRYGRGKGLFSINYFTFSVLRQYHVLFLLIIIFRSLFSGYSYFSLYVMCQNKKYRESKLNLYQIPKIVYICMYYLW